MDSSLKEHATAKSTWIKGLFIILFAIFYNIAEILVAVVVALQFFTVLITGKENNRLLTFGQSLSTYIYQVMRFITFNSEEKPFPFSSWPPNDSVQPAQVVSTPKPDEPVPKAKPKKARPKKAPAAKSAATAVVREETKVVEGQSEQKQSKDTPVDT